VIGWTLLSAAFDYLYAFDLDTLKSFLLTI
jgi:hypothetical protein